MNGAPQKAVCKLCMKEMDWKWNDQDEKYWEKDKISCPYTTDIPKTYALFSCEHKPAHDGCLFVIDERKL